MLTEINTQTQQKRLITKNRFPETEVLCQHKNKKRLDKKPKLLKITWKEYRENNKQDNKWYTYSCEIDFCVFHRILDQIST